MDARRAAALIAAGIATAAGGPAAAQAIDPFSGEETYARYCASCHGEAGRGDGPVAGAIPVAVPDLTRIGGGGGRFDAAALRRVIDGTDPVTAHGTRYMPVWGYEFWVEEGADDAARARVETIIANLVDYLRSLQR